MDYYFHACCRCHHNAISDSDMKTAQDAQDKVKMLVVKDKAKMFAGLKMFGMDKEKILDMVLAEKKMEMMQIGVDKEMKKAAMDMVKAFAEMDKGLVGEDKMVVGMDKAVVVETDTDQKTAWAQIVDNQKVVEEQQIPDKWDNLREQQHVGGVDTSLNPKQKIITFKILRIQHQSFFFKASNNLEIPEKFI